jgi:type VI secretion system secreted protein VgrG
MQRAATAGGGHQFIPRIGQEVLVGFLGNDIDRPLVIASLYNGRGESGISPTPGGALARPDTAALAESTDHRPSSQMNRINSGSGGNSPAWHGAAPGAATEGSEGQANAAALSGVKSKEFGGNGHNQLVLDDTPNQLRTQLHSTHNQTWLQMGHLLHQADNHRGSFRGLGFELRTDGWGGLRAARGVMLSTFGLNNGLGQTAEPAGDNAPGMALAKQAQQLSETFHQAATTHQSVGLATAAGSQQAGHSALDDQAAPAAALTKSLSGMVSSTSLPNALADAADRLTQGGTDKVPHTADPDIALIGKAGIGLTAGQDLNLSSGDTTQIASGQDTHWAVGGQARVQTGQAIGILAGAIQPGTESAGKGLTMIAAQGPIDMQAQAGPAQVAAKQTLELKTASGVVNIAAAKKVVLAVAGGASITIEGGQFTAQCPGKITVKAGKKAMVGPGTMSWAMPSMPKSSMPVRDLDFKFMLTDVPGSAAHPLAHAPWKLARSAHAPEGMAWIEDEQLIAAGESDQSGHICLDAAQKKALSEAYCRHPNDIWLVYPGHAVKVNVDQEHADWSPDEKLLQAMSAADFSVDVHAHRHQAGSRDELQYARQATQTQSDQALTGKLKGA